MPDLEPAGDEGVNAARDRRAKGRDGDDYPGREPVEYHAYLRGNDGAQQQLALAADVEDADSRADVAGHAAQAEHHRVLQHVADVPGV